MEIPAGVDMMEIGIPADPKSEAANLTEQRSRIFEELMVYQKKVFLICLGFSRNSSDAQDLAQEVYLRAYKNIHTLDNLSLSKYWLFRIARNTCLNFRKKHRLDRISAFEAIRQNIDPQNPESRMIHRERLLALKLVIQNLPKNQRDVFVLKEYGNLTYEEIAETLNIKQGTVMSRLNRARQAIKEKIKEEQNV